MENYMDIIFIVCLVLETVAVVCQRLKRNKNPVQRSYGAQTT